jgi:hypothetical protein
MTLKKFSIHLDRVGFLLLLSTIFVLIFKSLFIDYFDDFNDGNLAVVIPDNRMSFNDLFVTYQIFTMFSFFAWSAMLKNIILQRQVTIRFKLSVCILVILCSTAHTAFVFMLYPIHFSAANVITIFLIFFCSNLTLKKKLKWNKIEDEMERETPVYDRNAPITNNTPSIK